MSDGRHGGTEDGPDANGRNQVVPFGQGPDRTNNLEHVQFRELMDIERARIDSSNKRTDVVREMIAAQVEQNAREFDYANRRMEADERREKRRLSLFTRIVVSGGIIGVIVLAILLTISFYGSPENAALAQRWLTGIVQAFGGGAFLVILGQILLRLLKSPKDS